MRIIPINPIVLMLSRTEITILCESVKNRHYSIAFANGIG